MKTFLHASLITVLATSFAMAEEVVGKPYGCGAKYAK